jgi:hypothetical protein
MLDLDPRDFDSRDRDNDRPDPSRGGRAGDDTREPDAPSRDPRDVPLRNLHLPRDPDRELVRVQERTYELNGRQSRALATVGAFRVVRTDDIRDAADPRDRDLLHLRDQGLIKNVPLGGRDRDVVVLTREGRELLEARRRDDAGGPRQEFYAGLRKPREVTHDAAVYRAYRRSAERLQAEGARLDRIVLDYELKREYQAFLQEENRGQSDSDGRPRRDEEEVEGWARDRGLPYFDDQVHFPDVRIEYEDRDGRSRHEDIEVITPHYRGAHAAASARAGFTCYCTIGGRAGGRSGGRPWDPRLAEEFI